MKKLTTLLFALGYGVFMWAYDFKSGLLCYNILSETDLTVEVTYQARSRGNYSTLAGANIPEQVTYNDKKYTVVAISDYTFQSDGGNSSSPDDNTVLTIVNIPKTVKSIGVAAFRDCTALNTVNFLGDGLIDIGNYAFYYTISLKSIKFPKTLEKIGDYAFRNNCPSCKNYGLSGTLVIPNSVESIGKYAFESLAISRVEIGNNVTTIGEGAFDNCKNLSSVTLGKSIVSLGKESFAYCTALASITLPKSLKNIDDGAFKNCDNLNTVYLESLIPPSFINTSILPSSVNNFYVPCGCAETYFLSDWITFTTNFQEQCDKKYTIYVNQDCTSSIE